MQVGLLGPLAVWDDGGADLRVPGAPKERAVLELLALRAGAVVSADHLIGALWAQDPPRSAPKTLQTYVSKLRHLFPGMIETTIGGYRLRLDPDAVDVVAFERLLDQGRQAMRDGVPGDTAQCLARALGLWRGEPLQDLGDGPAAAAEAGRLLELRRDAEELLAEARLALGQHEAMIGDLEKAVAAEPLRERRWAQLMLALYRSGRQAEALRTYQDLRRVLGDELGLVPSAQTRSLEAAIATQDPSLQQFAARSEVAAATSSGSPAAPRHNVPVQLTRFVGRERELAQLRRMVGQSRLVTLTGAGGSGKTRLALQIGSDQVDAFHDGVWLADLGPLSDAELVDSTVARVFGIVPRAGSPVVDALVEALSLQEVLVILDNCEHLIGAAAKLADRILRSCPRAQLIATSREPLGIAGEAVFRVPPLSLPAPDDDAVAALSCDSLALFLERASDHALDLPTDDETVSRMSAVCRRLDGMPLALELAAARLRSMSLQDLEGRLDQRLRLLTGGSRTALERQQTLRATVEWSFSLLNEPERRTLCRLSVFPDVFDLAAAEAVAGHDGTDAFDVADLVGSLVDKSLVVLEAAGMARRYRLLETIRQFAAERLPADEVPRLTLAHRAFFVAFAEQAAPLLDSASQWEWFERLDAVRADLRQALRHAVLDDGGTRDALRLCVALRKYWRWRPWDPDEMLALLELLERPDAGDDPSLRAAALLSLSKITERLDFDRGWPLVEEAIELYRGLGDAQGLAMATAGLATLQFWTHDLERARAVATRAAELARASGDDVSVVSAIQVLISVVDPDDPDTLTSLLEEGLACTARSGDSAARLNLLNNAANSALTLGDRVAARAYLEEAAAILHQRGASDWAITANLGWLRHEEGEPDQARAGFLEVVETCRREGYRVGIAIGLLGLACVAMGGADAERAAFLYGAADHWIATVGRPFEDLEGRYRDDGVAAARAQLGDDAFERRYRSGGAAGLSEALEVAGAR